MQDYKAVIDAAQARAKENQLPYAGAVTPQEAYALSSMPETVLVDVRSTAELELVGRIPEAIHIEWAFYPGMVPNAAFAEQLQKKVDKTKNVIFVCRTGGRSHNAAMLADSMGYDHAYNMLEGFEGATNQQNQRTMINGWKQANLPWTN